MHIRGRGGEKTCDAGKAMPDRGKLDVSGATQIARSGSAVASGAVKASAAMRLRPRCFVTALIQASSRAHHPDPETRKERISLGRKPPRSRTEPFVNRATGPLLAHTIHVHTPVAPAPMV